MSTTKISSTLDEDLFPSELPEEQRYSTTEFLNAVRAEYLDSDIRVVFVPPKNNSDKQRFVVTMEPFKLTELDSETFHGDLINAAKKSCSKANELGVFFIPNIGENNADKITDFPVVFWERDEGSFEEQHSLADAFSLKTLTRVETFKSVHNYYGLKPGCSKDQWVRLQVLLNLWFCSDKSLKNPNRLMRLPGFDHKRLENDQLVSTPVKCVQLDKTAIYDADYIESVLRTHLLTRFNDEKLRQLISEQIRNETKVDGNRPLTAKSYQLRQIPKELVEPGECHQFAVETAGQLKAMGYTGDLALKVLRIVYDAKCSHEPDKDELENIVDWIDNKDESNSDFHLGNLVRKARTISGLGKAGAFMRDNSRELPTAIIPGVYPGFVALLVATNNVGKTKLMRNLAISLSTGKPYLNLTYGGDPVRVAYFDMEDETIHTQHDLANMLEGFSKDELQDFDTNFLAFIDEEIDDEPLDLSNEIHWEHVNKRLDSFKPQVIFIDTAVAAFKIENENDNSEIGALMKKLRYFARHHNAAVIVAHHTGKQGENGLNQRVSITARGATVFEDQARSVYTLDVIKPKMKGLIALDKVVRLKGKKIKGAHIEDIYLEFDTTGKKRWFTEIGGVEEDGNDVIPATVRQEEREERFLSLLKSNEKISRRVGMEHMGMSQHTFDDFTNDLISRKLIIKEQSGERRPVTFSLNSSLSSSN